MAGGGRRAAVDVHVNVAQAPTGADWRIANRTQTQKRQWAVASALPFLPNLIHQCQEGRHGGFFSLPAVP